jgi:signal transduction histidine kinase
LKSYSRWELNDAPVTANIVEYLETVLTLYRNEFKKGVQVVKNYTDIPDIICYPDQLNQVWTNLISNAIHAMNNQGTLTFDVGQENSEVKVSITDTGSGIDPSIKDKIFEPFFTTKPRGEGTGLGLDIIKKIVDKHQGRIELTSVPHCTTFTIYLPINAKLSS